MVAGSFSQFLLTPKPESLSEHNFLEKIQANKGIIYKLVGLYANNPEDKKDMYQEILLNAWKGWPSFRHEAQFSTWLYRVCLNTIFSLNRKKNLIQYQDSMENYEMAVIANPHENETIDRLKKALRLLSEVDRAIISMYLDGFENTEIADILGISPNNTAVKIHRIKSQLAKRLNPA